MKPERAYQRLQELMAKRDATIPPAGASRDSPEFVTFMRAERRVGDFLDRHDRELAMLREPAEGMTVDRYRERLAQPNAELDWLEAHAAEAGYTGVAQDAYSVTWIDRQAFAANYDPGAESEAEPEGALRMRRLRRETEQDAIDLNRDRRDRSLDGGRG